MVAYGKETSYRIQMNTTQEAILSQDETFEKFHIPPIEVLRGNARLIEFELDKLEIKIMCEDSGTAHPPETDEKYEQEPQAEIGQHISSSNSSQDINFSNDTIQQI